MAASTDLQQVWRQAGALLQAKVDVDTFERFFAALTPVQFDATTQVLTLGTESDFVAVWLTDNYRDVVQEALAQVLPQPAQVCFEGGHAPPPGVPAAPPPAPLPLAGGKTAAGEEAAATTANATAAAVATAQWFGAGESEAAPRQADDFVSPPCCRKDYTFENFVIGNNNRIPVAAAQAVCKRPGKAYNPLFIYGGTGQGKTHLLMAIANEVARLRRRARIQYVTSEDFVNQYVEATQGNTFASFRRHFRSLDVLLIDDVQFFEGKVGSSEEFFHTFNTLYNAHKQIILASDRTPQEISGLQQRLVSRFEWGLSAEVLPPTDLETRVAILKKKQEPHRCKLSDEVLFYVAEHVKSNIRNLESALTKLIMNISTLNCEMTVKQAEELLRDKLEHEAARVPSIDLIQRKVAEHYDLRVADMMSKKRPKNIAEPRMVAMYLARQLTGISLTTIGEAFNRNHATVIHAVDTVSRRLEAEETLRTAVTTLTRQLHSS